MREEQIDKYIKERLSDEQREAFELELAQDAELRAEVELQREIVTAIRVKGAREMLQEREAEIAQQEREAEIARQEREAAERRRRRIFTWSIATMAVAACFVVGLFIHYDNVASYKSYGMSIQLESVELRGGEQPLTNKIVEAINSANYNSALKLIAQGQSKAFHTDEQDPEARAFERECYQRDQDDYNWYKAVTYMRMGKWWKARKLLKQIASSKSHYKAQAQRALKAL